MVIVDGKIVSDMLFSHHFLCAVDKCKGACCIEGDMGAPLEEEEIQTLKNLLPMLNPRLPKAGQEALADGHVAVWYEEMKAKGTPLRSDGACAFVRISEEGIATCSIEEAWQEGLTDFRKPVSCQLYPIRVEQGPEGGFEALNYDQWDICAPACQQGTERKIKVYEFAREAIIRKYGAPFYGALQVADPHRLKTNEPPFE
ncbi:MAG: DUF3109 family protein [Bacteroidetes bacterium]|jgi:hypothetical protein|nr:DUF3109 family protein [Bacteroidota bacterium]